MAEAQELLDWLVRSQNKDGGWSYTCGTSWAEPTALAVLALRAQQQSAIPSALDLGVRWLLSQQKASGGWSPNKNVTECTSVTSLATLALLSTRVYRTVPSDRLDSAIAWIADQVYTDDASLSLFLSRVLNQPPAHAPGSVAWYPGTAGWVTPTSLAALALLKASQDGRTPKYHDLASHCCAYLLSRRCADQGWNHGGSKTRSEDATSYPETTGLALLALRASSIQPPPQSESIARKFALNPESIEGLCWIQMALQNTTAPIHDPEHLPAVRTMRDCALRLISLAAQKGTNVFLA